MNDEALTKEDAITHNRRRFSAYSAANGKSPAVQFIQDNGVYDQWLTNQAEVFSVEIGKPAAEWNVRDHVKFTSRLEGMQ